MTHTRFLAIALPIIAIPALIVLVLPAGVWTAYVDVVEPLALLVGCGLALWTSFSYRKQLKAAFIFLSAFLFVYMLAIILFMSLEHPILLPYLRPNLEITQILLIVQIIQFINYFILILFCINLLKVMDIRQLNRNGWFLFALTIVFSIFLAIYPELSLVKGISGAGLPAVLYLIIRLLDAALIIVLLPVCWLYIQYLKSRQRQSLTFTVIIFGIVFVTLFDYLFQAILAIFPQLLTGGSLLRATIPEMIFIYGYLIIAVGLYAHRRQDSWGYNTVDRTMSGKVKVNIE
ncbi:hypothetical protein ACFLTZ_04705 [Chloroflexota bacterium]